MVQERMQILEAARMCKSAHGVVNRDRQGVSGLVFMLWDMICGASRSHLHARAFKGRARCSLC
jgi:hypothetical protein